MSTLAINGGTPVRTKPFLGWPVFGREEEEALLRALRSGVWGSIDGTFVKELEVEFAHAPGRRATGSRASTARWPCRSPSRRSASGRATR